MTKPLTKDLEYGIEEIHRTKAANGTYRVFVYGSLMTDFHNNKLLPTKPISKEAKTTHPHYKMKDLGAFPGVVAGSDQIHGEVYLVNEDTLADLHALESHPNFYHATTTLVNINSNTHNWCLMYKLTNDAAYKNKNNINSGNWRKHQQSNG